jgi:hypothetical protein
MMASWLSTACAALHCMRDSCLCLLCKHALLHQPDPVLPVLLMTQGMLSAWLD